MFKIRFFTPWFRIRIWIYTEAYADPGSGSALQGMRNLITDVNKKFPFVPVPACKTKV